ncbi:hypothetical protein [Paractinoplanes durhamensis]|uniref:Adhesin domain-containing protein n=1 Tax=Paractinoplanes durhamensis TaxID=113563 RepID=A0ABQ3YZ67_9ACTN|nr:hypothetical protein [Actinoplanes durhamensis]GIE02878.1 hypothetical protein Adu01nite_42280 [Actinoplanes durhamensis]
MDREAADDASDVAVADPTAFGTRRGREGDTLYRRPPAHPPVDSTTGGSWFTDGTDVPGFSAIRPSSGGPSSDSAAAEPAAPDFGPATPRGSGRASFGFSDGPISPKRTAPTSGPPAATSDDADYADYPDTGFPEPGLSDTGYSRSIYSDEFTPAAGRRSAEPSPIDPRPMEPALPAISNWPPPARLSPGLDTLDRVPAATALSGTSDEFASWRSETGERRAVRHEREPAVERPAAPKQSRAVTIGMLVLSAIVLLAGGVFGVVYFAGSDDNLDSVLQLGAGNAGKRTATAPLDNRTKASFELLAGTNSVHVTIGELGDDLYRISTPDDAGFVPDPTIRNDDVKLQVSKDGDGIGGEIEVVLAAKVRWALRFSGYAEKQVIDVSGGQISSLEMVAGMRTAQLTLSRPSGTVPVKINGAADSMILRSPSANPVRIKLGGGAQQVIAGSRTLKDVVAGSTLTPKGWDVANRYDVTAGARITSLTVENA